MYTALLVVHLLISVTLIALVLIQQGKGADAGAAFGSGASNTVFGARGSASFLSKVTGALAAGFFATSLVLAIMAGNFYSPSSIVPTDDQGASSAPAPEKAPADTSGGEQAPAPAPDESR
jgi:preprotein translocase subunit SecG